MSNNVIINSGFNEILGTDRFENSYEKPSEKYIEYRRKWSENPKKFILEDFPLHVDIESTNACNLRCVMCPRNFMTEKIGFIDFSLYKKIVDEGCEQKLPSIKLNYRGEPLMHPRIVDLVKYAKDKGIMEVQFNTNGLLLTEEKADALINAGLDRIIFSFDGATKETYEKIRTGSNYETVINNIKKFVELRNNLGNKKPYVRVQFVRMEQNKHEVDQFISMWKDIANRLSVHAFKSPEGENKNLESLNHFPCPRIWQRIMVYWDGEVVMCCGDWKRSYRLGNAKESTIYEIWHSEKYNKVRDFHKNGKFDAIEVCAKCEDNTPLYDEELANLLKKYAKPSEL